MGFDKNNSRDAISHVITSYAKYFSSGRDLSDEDLFRFVLFSLSFDYWRNNKSLLLNLCRGSDGYELLLEKMGNPQLVHIESASNLKDIVQSFERKRLSSDTKIQFLKDGNNVVSIKMYSNRELEVIAYSPWAVIVKGELIPINDGTEVRYTKNRKLKEGIFHSLRNKNGFYIIRPTQNDFGITCLQGHCFREKVLGTFSDLKSIAPVFFCLKRLERLFVDKKSDQYYQMIISQLRLAITGLSLKKEKAVSESIKIYEFVRAIHEEIYVDDLPLVFLLKELEFKIKETQYESSSKQIHIPMRSM